MDLLSLRGVTRTVALPDRTALHILRGVNLDVAAGDHLAIVGRSGTGKTTLLNILGLLDAPSAGEYLIGGEPVSRIRSTRRAHLRGATFGFVFQQFNLLPGRTALQNVVAPLLYATGKEFWQRERLAAEMLDRVGLSDHLDDDPTTLSGGEQQRVAIARALVRSPRVILADEPTGALDVETGANVMGLLEEVAARTRAALIVITHDPAVAARAPRLVELADGILRPLPPGHGRAAPVGAAAGLAPHPGSAAPGRVEARAADDPTAPLPAIGDER